MTEYGSQIAFALILGIPVACITWTVTQEEIFKEFRCFLVDCQARYRQSWWRSKLAYVPTCPYCLSHYVSGILALLLHFKMLAGDWRGYLISLFTLVLIANVYITVYQLLRVALRWARSLADRAEEVASAISTGKLTSQLAVASRDLADAIPALRQSARRMATDRRA